MKIGIITFHHAFNYGAALQAYALSHHLNQLGHDAKIIDYRPRSAVKHYWRGILLRKRAPFYLLQARRFNSFVRHHLPLAHPAIHDPHKLERCTDQFDALITGSDQVWHIGGFRSFDQAYFLAFADPHRSRLISYAPSFGSMTEPGPHATQIASLLNRLHHCSVRDDSSAELVEKLTGKTPRIVLDPTFLIRYDHLLSGQRIVKENYLLAYGLFSPAEKRFLQALAQHRGLKVVNVGFSMPGSTSQSILTAGPLQWLNLFAGSSYVVTNFFHGTIFAALFEKPFVVSDIQRQDKRMKVSDLLQRLGLTDRAIAPGLDAAGAVQQADRQIDFAPVRRAIEQQVAQSRQFLSEAIDG